MELSQDLMSKGSYHVEASDEKLKTDDIADSLRVVINAVTKSDLPPADVAAWFAGMTRRDRVGCICDRELAALSKSVKR
jgi:hypothetical protein